MSIVAALLLVGALGIMILMHSMGHGRHGASHGTHEDDQAGGDEPTSRRQPEE